MTGSPVTHVFLSGVRASTHLIYAASYLRHLLATTSGTIEVLLLDAGGGFGHARVGSDEAHRLLPADPRLTVVTDLPSRHWKLGDGGSRILLSVGAPGLRAYTQLARSGRGVPKVVVVDEGVGSYGTWRTRRNAYRRQGGGAVWPTLRAAVVTLGNRLLTDIRWSLYEERARRWTVNEAVAAEFRERAAGGPAKPSAAVYLGQPWPEIGVMSEQAYAGHLNQVRTACERAGLGLVVRPHPSEPRARYAGFEVTKGSGPAELDREVIDAPVLVGTQSTALLNLVAIHGCTAVRVAEPALAKLDRALGPRQRELLATFVPEPVGLAQLPAALREALGRA